MNTLLDRKDMKMNVCMIRIKIKLLILNKENRSLCKSLPANDNCRKCRQNSFQSQLDCLPHQPTHLINLYSVPLLCGYNLMRFLIFCFVRCSRITDIGVGYLSTMTSLRRLFLRWCTQIRDFSLKHIYSMRNLRVLSLAGTIT